MACKESQGLPLETEPGNIAKCAQPISSPLFGSGLDYKFQSDAERQSSWLQEESSPHAKGVPSRKKELSSGLHKPFPITINTIYLFITINDCGSSKILGIR